MPMKPPPFARAFLAAVIGWALAGPVQADAPSLKARLAALQPALAKNAFGRPLHIESTETSGDLKGDVHAVVAHPFADVVDALKSRDNWCDILILPFNVKQCLAPDDGRSLKVRIGRKFHQPVEDAYEVNFMYRMVDQGPNHIEVHLNAAEGPLGTRDYRIVVEAIPIDAQHAFIRLSYAYGFGMAARLAMKGYLATTGSDKIGFSVTDRPANGDPVYVGGVRGVIERNAMRYFLAIDAYLNAPGDAERRALDWFVASERYPRQLHEMAQATYLEMKRREVRRQEKAGS